MSKPYLRVLFLVSLLTPLTLLAAADSQTSSASEGTATQFPSRLEGTNPADIPPDILVRQHEQIDKYWLEEIAKTRGRREKLWQPDFSSTSAYRDSVREHRENLRKMLGLASPPEIRRIAGRHALSEGLFRVEALSVPVDQELEAKVLLFHPEKAAGVAVIAIPPAEQTREEFSGLASGRKVADWLTTLLSRGITVLIPTTIQDSADHPWGKIAWNDEMSRRRYLHRLAFPVGKTMTGLEVQQVLAIKTYLVENLPQASGKIALMGDRQGGMTAFYAGAVDEAFSAVAVVDYFQQRENCWTEPVDRMLYGQLNEFGDAEVAALIAPRRLLVLSPPGGNCDPEAVKPEMERAMRFYRGLGQAQALTLDAGSTALSRAALALAQELVPSTRATRGELTLAIGADDTRNNQEVQFDSLHRYLRRMIAESGKKRESFWRLQETAGEQHREKTEQLIGELRRLMGVIETDATPMNPRTNLLDQTDEWAAYEVLVDVVPGVEAWGYLLIPKSGQRPFGAVIAQHGGGGTPANVTGIGETRDTVYYEFARHLAEQGYVVFAPLVAVGNRPVPEAENRQHEVLLGIMKGINPKVRKAAALGMMRTSLEQAKLRRIVDFLQSLPFVDAERIGYYGLSYGGYSTTWMTAQEPRIKATVISGHFNDWTPKITGERIATSYLRHPDEDFANWNVLHRFTHTELIAAMWPRAVCVEYGEGDAVTPPGWFRTAWRSLQQWAHSWEVSDRITSVYFDGGHEIHAVHVFDFLDRWLRPEKGARREYVFKPPVREREGNQQAVQEAIILHEIDTSLKNRVVGKFFVPASAPVFSGLAIQAARKGQPGDLVIRFGSEPGLEDVGVVRIRPGSVPEGTPAWLESRMNPVRLNPGATYYFEIAPEWGWKSAGDYYLLAGPKPLGGTHILPEFGLFYRALVSGSGLGENNSQ
jgi:dienelactone hydrolase